jgi:Domain of unknown function (DUF811).
MHRQVPWKLIAILTTTTTLLLSLLLLRACSVKESQAPVSGPPQIVIPAIGRETFHIPTEAMAKAPTQVFMRKVWFHIDQDAYLDVHSMRGELVSKTPGAPLNLDNKRSFVMKVDRAKIGMRSASLDVLMNRYVFGYAHPPLRNLHVEPSGSQLLLSGTMHKLVDISFTMRADVSASNGLIRIHPIKIQTFGISGIGLLKAVGMTLEKLLPMPKERGISAQGNDLLLDPQRALPPPQVDLRLVDVRIEGDELMMFFDAGRHLPELALPHPEEKNTIYFRGGTLRMGKLLMVDADMQVGDTDPADPFDFYIDRYNDQLVAGFSRNRPNYGLSVFMRDSADVGKPARPGEHLLP